MPERRETSFYHCGYCTEEPCIELVCPVCGLGKMSDPEALNEVVGHIVKIRDERKELFQVMRENYDWGYIAACNEIMAKLKEIFKEHQDVSDGIG